MELRGHKQATAHSHEHTKNSNPSKKYFTQRQNSNSNLLINSKNSPKSFEFISGGIVLPDLCHSRSPCSKTYSWSSVWNMDSNFKVVVSKKVASSSSKERTTWSRAGHLTAGPRLQIIMSRRGHRLVSFCPKRTSKSAWWRCVKLTMCSLTC